LRVGEDTERQAQLPEKRAGIFNDFPTQLMIAKINKQISFEGTDPMLPINASPDRTPGSRRAVELPSGHSAR